ncbi:MAG: MazG nucleotide pyrophosphohydrolase domain-containing protein [Candidatus Hodarchaeales archaeon]|jgi:NTP pyrophosphatase (non-canonical NTP hydrolase)
MDLTKLAAEIDSFINNHGGYWEPAWLLSAIIEEVGELSRAMQVFAGIREEGASTISPAMIQDIEEESGDLLFALLCLTNNFGINLEKALLNTLKKYKQRESGIYDAVS